MIAPFLVCLIGAVSFSSEPLDGVHIAPPNPYSGVSQCNWLPFDANRDGAQDWLTIEGVHVQVDGRFPANQFRKLDSAPSAAYMDVWKDTVWFWDKNTLTQFAMDNGAWKEIATQDLPNPMINLSALNVTRRNLTRFLFDLDGDALAELVAISEEGMQIFAMQDGRYRLRGTLEVLPAMSLLPAMETALWPMGERHIQIPQRYRYARIWLEDHSVNVLTWKNLPADTRQFTLKTWELSSSVTAGFTVQNLNVQETFPLPMTAMPCRLNADPQLDFAGSELQTATGAAVPQPILNAWATLDAGKTVHTRRSAATYRFRQHVQFVDFDGDGDLDFVTESPDIFQHGLRETLGRFTTRTHIQLNIEVFLQVENKFEETPALSHTVDIHFSAPPIKATPDFEAWLSGKRVNFTGDFNADGFRDLVVRDRENHLAIYLAERFHIPAKPSSQITLEPSQNFAVFDMNNDGLSDIIISPPQSSGDAVPAIVHYAQEEVR